MNLTYELVGNGYIILNNGVKWITQTDFIPYPGATIEESAQNHIAALLKDLEGNLNQQTEVEKLKTQVEDQENAIVELSMIVGSLMK